MSEFLVLPYVLGLVIKDGKVLLLQRSHTGFGDGMYALPGGKIDAGESPPQAIVRELSEEIGIASSLENVELGTIFYFQGQTRECVAFVFKITDWKGEPYNKEPQKHNHCAWFSLSNLPDTLLPRHIQMIHNANAGIYYGDEGFEERLTI